MSPEEIRAIRAKSFDDELCEYHGGYEFLALRDAMMAFILNAPEFEKETELAYEVGSALAALQAKIIASGK